MPVAGKFKVCTKDLKENVCTDLSRNEVNDIFTVADLGKNKRDLHITYTERVQKSYGDSSKKIAKLLNVEEE